MVEVKVMCGNYSHVNLELPNEGSHCFVWQYRIIKVTRQADLIQKNFSNLLQLFFTLSKHQKLYCMF